MVLARAWFKQCYDFNGNSNAVDVFVKLPLVVFLIDSLLFSGQVMTKNGISYSLPDTMALAYKVSPAHSSAVSPI